MVSCQPDKTKLSEFYEQMRLLTSDPPQLFLKFHPIVNNIECMVAEDLTLGFGARPLPDDPSLKAIGFVRAAASMLGVEQVFVERFLFLKHVLQSPMGTHCILGLRRRDQELHGSLFVVHLDRLNRITMLTATYQAIPPPDDALVDDPWRRRLTQTETDLESSSGRPADILGDILQITRKGFLWVPDWSTERYVLKCKLSITTDVSSYVVFVDREGKCDVYPATGEDRPHSMSSTYVYTTAWSSSLEGDPQLKRVILRDLEINREMLAGRYVAVGDRINRKWPTVLDVLAEDSPELMQSTHFDRAMAYFHIDRIQRYFRSLGLTVLDEYPELNPLHVLLSGRQAHSTSKPRTQYDREKQHIVLCTIESDSDDQPSTSLTDARNARTLYHEFVHAATDALARLQRHYTAAGDPRSADVAQAEAMDEGLADYFACSVAELFSGREDPCYCTLRYDALTKRIGPAQEGDNRNRVRRLNQGEMDLGGGLRPNQTKYDLSLHWSRYLWLLRSKLGAEVMDLLAANSIFFLTRTSSFVLGVLALVMADRLLFGGINQKVILDTAKQRIADVAKKDIMSQQGGMHISPVDSPQDLPDAVTPQDSSALIDVSFDVPAAGVADSDGSPRPETGVLSGSDWGVLWYAQDGNLVKAEGEFLHQP
jgi:hypothetical protein